MRQSPDRPGDDAPIWPLSTRPEDLAPYRVLREGDPRCRHLTHVPLRGDSRLVWRIPVPCEDCYERFAMMVRFEADWLFARCDPPVAWVAEIPAAEDPFRDHWHLAVGSRLRVSDHAAFVLQTREQTLVVSTAGLWGGGGRMLKRLWHEDLTSSLRRRVELLLDDGLVTRGEMFFRPRFFEYLVPLEVSQWGVALIEEEVARLLGA